MIHHLRGKLTELNPTYAIIECNGIGYNVNISLNTYSKLAKSKEIYLLTHPIYKEDSQVLYGFYEEDERQVFKSLISVSGVGANTARVILSSLRPDEISTCIAKEDVSMLKSIKGIGAKTAQRIIVDLKDSIRLIESTMVSAMPMSNMGEATSALEVLGYSVKVTSRVLDVILKENPSISLEELIKTALKRI